MEVAKSGNVEELQKELVVTTKKLDKAAAKWVERTLIWRCAKRASSLNLYTPRRPSPLPKPSLNLSISQASRFTAIAGDILAVVVCFIEAKVLFEPSGTTLLIEPISERKLSPSWWQTSRSARK